MYGSPFMYFIFSSLVGAPIEENLKSLVQMLYLSLEHSRITGKKKIKYQCSPFENSMFSLDKAQTIPIHFCLKLHKVFSLCYL